METESEIKARAEAEYPVTYNRYNQNDGFAEIYREAYIKGYTEAMNRYGDRWIPVEERLPEDGHSVIAAYRYGVGEYRYFAGRFVLRTDLNTEIPNVTHWMPLPSPPTK